MFVLINKVQFDTTETIKEPFEGTPFERDPGRLSLCKESTLR
jgi:hypothetical protein